MIHPYRNCTGERGRTIRFGSGETEVSVVPLRLSRDETGEVVVETSFSGQLLIENPLLNKGSVFSDDERREFELLGLLPPQVSPPERQLERTYANYLTSHDDLERYLYLMALLDRNEVLFYRLVSEHIAEMVPIIYTPVVGDACLRYSHIYHRPRGLYVAYPHQGEIDRILDHVQHRDLKVIVVTDGERILGLGDLGVGGMGIPVGKLALYTICAGIHPANTLPVTLDVGTNNESLLNDPLYLGWRHERVRGDAYDEFIEAFVQAVTRRFPDVLLQWEDFALANARTLLDRYRDRLCAFNDDIQGTGAVTLAGVLAAVHVTGSPLAEQRVVILGAGSAATGIAEQLVAAMVSAGHDLAEARSMIWLLDSGGLVHTGRTIKEQGRKPYAQPAQRVAEWSVADPSHVTLEDVVGNVHPTILIGAAAQPGAFTEDIVREMARHVPRPIVFALSNPTSKCEATPAAVLEWTDGRALVATGSPFAPVVRGGLVTRIGQCNNSFVFPGVGLGVIAAGARRVSNEMFVAAARALSQLSPAEHDPADALYPPVEDVRSVSRHVALAVAAEAQRAGLAEPTTRTELEQRIARTMWTPRYPRLRRVAG
jgi:malate dehydrogenase (oxaloacetate-decarboxylating)